MSVVEDGSLLCGSDDLEVQIAFDVWWYSEACEHEGGLLVSHHIGNIARVAVLRAELGRWPERFPVILSRVVYSGTHCGDFLSIADNKRILAEIEALPGVHSSNADRELILRQFEEQMRDLVAAAHQVGKPIVF
jgi:hypothetical protein